MTTYIHFQGFNDNTGSKDLLVSQDEMELQGASFDPNDYFKSCDACDDWKIVGEEDLDLDLPEYMTSV